MQRQEINLYRTFAPSKASIGLSMWRIFYLSNAIFALLLSISFLFSIWQVHHLKKQQSQVAAQVKAKQTEFITLKNRYPAIFFSADLAQTIQQIKQGEAARGQIFQLLKMNLLYSETLLTLAKVITPNVWLTQINIKEGDDLINLQGQSIDIVALKSFLTNLSKDPVFSNYNLNLDNINDASKNTDSRLLSFNIKLIRKSQ